MNCLSLKEINGNVPDLQEIGNNMTEQFLKLRRKLIEKDLSSYDVRVIAIKQYVNKIVEII